MSMYSLVEPCDWYLVATIHVHPYSFLHHRAFIPRLILVQSVPHDDRGVRRKVSLGSHLTLLHKSVLACDRDLLL
jgi:hypothetical protein